jgi:hypothetical protein
MVLKRIFGLGPDEVIRYCEKPGNEEFHILYSSPNVIRMIKFRRMQWTEHVAGMFVVDRRNACRAFC